jgi:hypothetical protein
MPKIRWASGYATARGAPFLQVLAGNGQQFVIFYVPDGFVGQPALHIGQVYDQLAKRTSGTSSLNSASTCNSSCRTGFILW